MKYINKTDKTVGFGRFRMAPGSMLVDPSFTPAELSVVKYYISKGILSDKEEAKQSEAKQSEAKQEAAAKKVKETVVKAEDK